MVIHRVTFRGLEICIFSTQKRSQYKRSTTHGQKNHFYCFIPPVTAHKAKNCINQLLMIVYPPPPKSQPELTSFRESDPTMNAGDRVYGNTPQWCTADAEIKDPSVKNPELSKVFPLKPWVGQNIAMHASPIDRNFFLELIYTLLVHSPAPFP